MADDIRSAGLRALIDKAPDARTAALLEEAARVADRLDDLDAVIAGKGVLDLLRFRLVDDEGRVAEVKFDGVLAEARQQAMALRALLAQVGVPAVAAGKAEEKRSTLDRLRDDLAEKRASRAAEAEHLPPPAVRQ